MSVLGPNSVVSVMSAARPLFPRKRTSICNLAMSHSCPQADSYQAAERLTHRRHRLRRALRQYPIGPPYVFAMDVPVGRRQHESGSASFGIMHCSKRHLHSITSSARTSTVVGMSKPSAAVLRLITSSYLVGACTGKSAGFSPLRMRSTEPAARRYWPRRSDKLRREPPDQIAVGRN
jgi:hypothetical protein